MAAGADAPSRASVGRSAVAQTLLGATVAQAVGGPAARRRALAWGAVGGVLSDLDVVAVATHGPFGEFPYRRGVTHSLWFGPVIGVVLGWAACAGTRGAASPDRRAPAAPAMRSYGPVAVVWAGVLAVRAVRASTHVGGWRAVAAALAGLGVAVVLIAAVIRSARALSARGEPATFDLSPSVHSPPSTPRAPQRSAAPTRLAASA